MDIFKDLIKELTPFFKKLGFNKKGNNFYLQVQGNFGIITFQKSRESTKEEILFTINFGIYSDVLGRNQYDYSNNNIPEVNQCHWESRIGNFMIGKPDFWWKTSFSELSVTISSVSRAVEELVLHEINKRLSDEGLINCWLKEGYAGTTEIGKFKYLTTLLTKKEDHNTLDQVIENAMEQFEGKPNAVLAKQYLKELEHRNLK